MFRRFLDCQEGYASWQLYPEEEAPDYDTQPIIITPSPFNKFNRYITPSPSTSLTGTPPPHTSTSSKGTTTVAYSNTPSPFNKFDQDNNCSPESSQPHPSTSSTGTQMAAQFNPLPIQQVQQLHKWQPSTTHSPFNKFNRYTNGSPVQPPHHSTSSTGSKTAAKTIKMFNRPTIIFKLLKSSHYPRYSTERYLF